MAWIPPPQISVTAAVSPGPGTKCPSDSSRHPLSALNPPPPGSPVSDPRPPAVVISQLVTNVITSHGDNNGVTHVIPLDLSDDNNALLDALGSCNIIDFLAILSHSLSPIVMNSPAQTSGTGSAGSGPSSNPRDDAPFTSEETPLLARSSSSSSSRSSSVVKLSTQKDTDSRHVETQSKVHIPLARGIAIGVSLWLLIFLTGKSFIHRPRSSYCKFRDLLTHLQHVTCLV